MKKVLVWSMLIAVMLVLATAAMQALRRSDAGRSMAAKELQLMDGLGRWMLLEADAKADVEAMVEAYAALDAVVQAEPNYILDLVGAVPEAGTPHQQVGSGEIIKRFGG